MPTTHLGDSRIVQSIKQRGNSVYISLPKTLVRALGWNRHDVLSFQVIDNSMVMTRVDLPKVNLVRTDK